MTTTTSSVFLSVAIRLSYSRDTVNSTQLSARVLSTMPEMSANAKRRVSLYDAAQPDKQVGRSVGRSIGGHCVQIDDKQTRRVNTGGRATGTVGGSGSGGT